jgi:hypothetical protein
VYSRAGQGKSTMFFRWGALGCNSLLLMKSANWKA